MKKIVTITALVAVLILGLLALTGCDEKKENITEEVVVGGWTTILTDAKVNMDEEATQVFKTAEAEYLELELEPIALLGSQVVAGTNRMFLAKGYEKGSEDLVEYKIVIVYTDLENKSEITNVMDFDYSKYTHQNVEGNEDILAGGWTVSLPKEGAKLDTDIQKVFDEATSTITGVVYYPIAVLGSQVVAGTNYAVLCYGAPSVGEPERGTINLVTIYKNLVGTSEIISQSYINLADYNR